MKGKLKKKQLTVVSLFFGLVVLIGLYALYTKSKDKDKKEPVVTKTIDLASLPKEEINWFCMQREGNKLSLIRQDGVWKLEEDTKRPMHQGYIGNILDAIDDVVAINIVTASPESLEDYGLANPSVIIDATSKTGGKIKLQLGDAIPGNAGYYGIVNDDTTIYQVSSNYFTGTKYSLNDLTITEKAPAISSDTIFHMRTEQKGKDNFEVIYLDGNNVDYSGTGFFPWVIIQPYEIYMTADGSKVTDTAAKFAGIRFEDCVNYNCEDFSVYGLDDPMANILVEYYLINTVELDTPQIDKETGKEVTTNKTVEEKSFEVEVGDLNEAGYYYVRNKASKQVFTVSEAVINNILEVTGFSCINDYIHLISIDLLDKLEVNVAGTLYTMEVKREKTTDENGEQTTLATYYYNGKAVSEDIFKAVYQVVLGAHYDAEINVDVPKVAPYVEIAFHCSHLKEPMVIKYLPYNESFYAVDNGICAFFADKRRIDNIVTAITEFKGKK